MTSNDFELLRDAFFEIISEVNPAFDLEPKQRIAPSLYGKTMEFSENIRKGITQSLVLVSIYGNQLKLNTQINSENWVDSVVREFLVSDDPLLWKSISYYLNLIAEVSPNEFLNAIERNLSEGKSPLTALFEEDPGIIVNTTYHISLLWALEGLAWFPKYLARVSLVLIQLVKFEKNISVANKPMESLIQIFKPWHHQTLSKYEERMDVLRLISNKEPLIAWELLLKLLPTSHDSAQYTHKMRWRMFDTNTNLRYTYEETWKMHSDIISLLISLFDFSESHISILLKKSESFSPVDREKLLTYIDSNLNKIEQLNFLPWKTLREMLSHHRCYSSATWALSESELEKYENLSDKLAPKDNIPELVWMFESSHSSIFEDIRQKDMPREEEWKAINDKRISTLKNTYDNLGIEKIIELIEKVNAPSILGDISAHIINSQDEILELCNFLKKEDKCLYFIQGFFFRKSILLGNKWIFDLFNELDKTTFDCLSLARFFVPLPKSQELWDFIDSLEVKTKNEYWLSISDNFGRVSVDERIFGIKELMNYKRYISAVNVCYYYLEEIPTDLIIDILYKLGTESTIEEKYFNASQTITLFSTLDEREGLNKQRMIQLEWIFLPLLNSYSSRRSPNLLLKEISENAGFFNQLISYAYAPKENSKIHTTNNELTLEERHFRAEKAFSLLQSWHYIPGINESGNIDTEFLWNWISEVRAFAVNLKNEDVADIFIGKVLAHYPEPEGEGFWPPNEICEVIEKINTDALKTNFSVALFNKRGGMHGATGGRRERNLAQYFQKLASYHRNTYPIVAGILEDLAKGYIFDAEREELRHERDSVEY